MATVVRQAFAASAAGDRVLVIDSASIDDTAERARRAGAEIVRAALGKGRAMAAAAEATASPWICFLDADVSAGGSNYVAKLRAAVERTKADHVLGEYDDAHGAILSNTLAVYEPLVAHLFPEAADRFGSKPLTGFRAVRRKVLHPDKFSPDFGIEAYLNIAILLSGGTHELVLIGTYGGPFKYKPCMGFEIARAVLDLAECHGRLTPTARPAWEEWVGDAVAVIAGYRGTPEEQPALVQKLTALAARPAPPAS